MQSPIAVSVAEEFELDVYCCVHATNAYVRTYVPLPLCTGSLMCGLIEDGSLFLWMPGRDRAPAIRSTPLNGMKTDAKDWKGWASMQTGLLRMLHYLLISCLFQVA